MHYSYDGCILNIQDTSRGGTYHNKNFAKQAQKRGLIVTRSEKYGYAHTEPTEKLLEWVLLHDELREIEMCRNNPYSPSSIGAHSNNSNRAYTTISKTNHSRKYTSIVCSLLTLSVSFAPQATNDNINANESIIAIILFILISPLYKNNSVLEFIFIIIPLQNYVNANTAYNPIKNNKDIG